MNEVQARNLTPDELMECLEEHFGEWAKPVELMVQMLEWKIEELDEAVRDCEYCYDYRCEIDGLEHEVKRFEDLSTSMNATLNNVKKLLKDGGLMPEMQIDQAIELIELSQKQWRDQGEWV